MAKSKPDLAAIDRYVKKTAPKPNMDAVWERLDADSRYCLEAWTGLTHDGQERRPHSAVAAWLNDLALDGVIRVTSDQVSRWVASRSG